MLQLLPETRCISWRRCCQTLAYATVLMCVVCVLYSYVHIGQVFPQTKNLNISDQTRSTRHVEGDTKGKGGEPHSVVVTDGVGVDYGWYATVDDLPVLPDYGISCPLLFQGDVNETMWALKYEYKPDRQSTALVSSVADCEQFKTARGYLTKPVSAEEADFPLAFSLTMYKDPEQAERLLRAIYRPQNYYCIHVDKKSDDSVKDVMASVAKCFPNVFMSSKSAVVNWGYYSAIEPDLNCMDDLVKYKDWRYFINLTGQEFPLKTNLDMVKILKVFRGANDIPEIPMSKLSGGIRQRIEFKHIEGKGQTAIKKKPFPYNVTMAKGAVHILAYRAYVEYVVKDPVALEFRGWCQDTGHADEHYFNSLEYSPQLGVPGAFRGEPARNMGVARWKEWADQGYKCQGKMVRSICIIGVGDLPSLYSTKFLFVNKLHVGYHPLAYSCWEELHFNRTRDDIVGHRQIDVKLYSQLSFVQDRVAMLHEANTY